MEGTGKVGTISAEAFAEYFKQAQSTSEEETTKEEVEGSEEEVIIPDEEEPKEEGEKVEQPKIQQNVLSKTAKNLLERGSWTDYSVTIDGVDYESIGEYLDSVEVTEDIFEALAEKQLELEKEDLKSKTISTEGLDETRVKIIEAIKNGLNYEPLLNINDNFITPLKNMDFSNSSDAEQVCLYDLKNQYGDDSEFIEYKLNTLKEKGLLESTAEDLRVKYISEFEKMMYDKQQEIKVAEQESIQKLKEDKKVFRASLKEKEYGDVFSKKIVDFIYEKDNNGSEDWYSLIKTKLEDKDFATKFAHFVLDYEDFLNKEFSSFKRSDKLSTLEKINITTTSKKSKDGGQAPDKQKPTSSLFSENVQFVNNSTK